jgi:hypothetical protein
MEESTGLTHAAGDIGAPISSQGSGITQLIGMIQGMFGGSGGAKGGKLCFLELNLNFDFLELNLNFEHSLWKDYHNLFVFLKWASEAAFTTQSYHRACNSY